MARQLLAKQKTLLRKWFANNPEIYTVADLEDEQWQELEAINDTEILWMEANRYLAELSAERIAGFDNF